MDATFEDVPIGGCYRTSRGGVRKKVSENSYVTKGKKGPRKGRQKGTAKIRHANCTIDLIGVGLSGRKRGLVEMGRRKGRCD